jgi:hypothetical protein
MTEHPFGHGDRQMLPMQTKRTRVFIGDGFLFAISFSDEEIEL